MFQAFSGHAEESDKKKEKEKIYILTQHFTKAQAEREISGRIYAGQLKGERIQFEGLPGIADIFVTESAVVEGKTRPVIWFQPLQNSENSLIFRDVPPGRKLHLFYALPDWTFQKQQVTPVQFEVWFGKRKLLETRVSTKGWKEKILDLTLPFLLQRKGRLVFKVGVAGQRPESFVFYGAIE
jgi:hypothetical protein